MNSPRSLEHHTTAPQGEPEAPRIVPTQDSFAAFLSYRRVDATAFARWLREQLETFEFPSALEHRQQEARVFLDTSYGRGTEDFWKNNIVPALETSSRLIVIASPAALLSLDGGLPNWVAREIEHYRALPQGKNITVALLRGEISGPLPGGLRDSFPNIHIADFRRFRRWAPLLLQPEAVQQAFLDVIAALFRITPEEMPLLRMEQEQRRRRVAARIATIAAAVGVVLLAALTYALFEQAEAVQASQAAIAQRMHAEQESRAARASSAAAIARSIMAREPTSAVLLAARAVQLRQPGDPELTDPEASLREALASLHSETLSGRRPVGSDSSWTSAVAVHPDWRAVGTWDGAIYVWPAPHAGPAEKPLQAYTPQLPWARYQGVKRAPVKEIRFSPDGRRLVVNSGERVTLYPLEPGRLGSPFSLPTSGDARIAPDGTSAAVLADAELYVWALVGEGAPSPRSLERASQPILKYAYSSDGASLVAWLQQGRVAVWSLKTGKVREIEVPRALRDKIPGEAELEGVSAGPQPGPVAVLFRFFSDRVQPQNAALVMDCSGTVASLLRVYPDRAQAIADIQFSPDGRWAASARDNKVELWDARQPTPAHPEELALPYEYARMRFGPAHRLAVATDSGHVLLWRLDSGRAVEELRESIVQEGVSIDAPLDFSSDGHALVVGYDNNVLRTWDLSLPGSPLEPLQLRSTSPWQTQALSPHGQWFAALEEDGEALLVRVDGTRLQEAYLSARFRRDAKLAFSADERWLVVYSTADKGVFLVDLSAEAPQHAPRLISVPESFEWVGFDSTSTWLLLTGRSAASLVHLESGAVTALPAPALSERYAFSPGGHWLVGEGGGHDQPLRLWRLDGPGVAEHQLSGLEGMKILSIVFRRDDATLAVSAQDNEGRARLFLQESSAAARELPSRGKPITLSDDGHWLLTEEFLADKPRPEGGWEERTVMAWSLANPEKPVMERTYAVQQLSGWFSSKEGWLVISTDGDSRAEFFNLRRPGEGPAFRLDSGAELARLWEFLESAGRGWLVTYS